MKFHCPSCGQKLEVATVYAGRNTICPACSGDVEIPAGQAALQPAEIDTAILEALTHQPAAADSPKTIAQFMSDRQIEGGGVKLGTEVLTGDQNRKYEYGEVVARGGMGAIIRATDQNIRRDVAMKVLLDPSAATNVEILRFIEEAQVTGQLEHPGVAPVHDLGVDGAGNVYYAMKFVKGLTLHQIFANIARRDEKTIKEYSLNRLLNVFQKVCEAMAFAHSKQVIHRDLKPENIMVGEFGEVLVMDWGLAKVLGHSADDPYVSPEAINSVRQQDITGALATVAGTICGTPQFMAPEQATGETGLMNRTTDVYALGAILYNILTLHPPVEGKTIDEVLNKVTNGEVKSPTSYNTQKSPKRVTEVRGLPQQQRLYHCPNERIPEALGAITMKAMAVKQDDRYQSVSELLGDIEKFQGGFATSAESAGAMKHLALFIKRNKFATVSVLLISMLGIGFVGKTISSERQIRAVSRKAAPKFVDEARAAIASNDDATALESIETAIGLDRQLPDAWFELARIKLGEFEFQEAIKAFDAAASVSDDKAEQDKARKYRKIAARWKTETAADGVLPEKIIELAAEIEPFDSVLASRIYSRTGDETKAMQLRLVSALGNLVAANPGLELQSYADGELKYGWHSFYGEHGLGLNFHHSGREHLSNIGPLAGLPMTNLEFFTHPISDLTPLEAMPIRRLILDGTHVVGLTSVRDMPLEELSISDTQITDLEPLRGRPLKKLTISRTKVADLGPLQGAPLAELNADDCRELVSLAPLRGLPIKSLTLQRAKKITDYSPLEGMPLEVLVLDGQEIRDLNVVRDAPLRELLVSNCPLEDLSALRGKSFEVLKLQNFLATDLSPLLEANAVGLNFSDGRLTNLDVLKSFTAMQRADIACEKLESLEALRGLPVERLTLRAGDRLTDLSGLEGMPLKHVALNIPAVTELSALRGMDLEHFEASGAFSDISVLAGQPLKRVHLVDCPDLVDLSPLAQCKDLEEVIVSKNAGNLQFLLELPKLRTVSYTSVPQDPAEFIRQHGDGQQAEN